MKENNRPFVYLACPYWHENPAIREQRFRAVNKVAGILIMRGDIVFSPISHSHPINETLTQRPPNTYWVDFDSAYLQHSYKMVVLMIDGWDRSAGIKAEMAMAKEMGIQTIFVNEDCEMHFR